MRHLPIGFIDSGYGGLTVVKQSLKQLPNESIIYLGDNARCPYGIRSLEEVKDFIWQMTIFLREKGIKMLVVACNTGTAAALEDLRRTISIPVVGVINPGSRVAIKETHNDKIGIIATPGTIQSGVYERDIKRKSDRLEVYSQACPEFVDIVEENRIHDPETQKIVNESLQPIVEAGVDTLVLGCTHYPMLKAQIQEAVGPEVNLVDSGKEAIDEVSGLLDYFNLARSAQEAHENPPSQVYYTTGDVAAFESMAQSWLEEDDLIVRGATIKGGLIHDNSHSQS